VQQNEQNLVIRQQKTKEVEYVYLTEKALELLGEPGKRNEYIFSIRRYDATINRIIGNWVKQAGITKKITFHSARHTFAVIQLTLGTDIYTVSKLLGHKKLETTQIYAKIIDQKKREAIEKMSVVL
jgi:Site-specific recombinase XerD